MSYETELLDKLADSDKWPTFVRGEFLGELNDFADEAYDKRTIEGYLASLLIYHQIVEEMTRLLIACSVFLIQLSLYPNQFKEKEKLDGKMFGELLKELEKGVLVEGIPEFITNSRNLNDLRIKMVHKITKKTSVSDIEMQTKIVKKLFDKIYEIFDSTYDTYRVAFSDYKKNIDEMRE